MEKKGLDQPISKDDVLSVYSGAHGCCCGCNGNHRYRESPIARDMASKKRGYKVSDDEVSERSVSLVVNKINANLDTAEDGGSYWSYETATRLYIAYKV